MSSPGPKPLPPNPLVPKPKPRGLGLTLKCYRLKGPISPKGTGADTKILWAYRLGPRIYLLGLTFPTPARVGGSVHQSIDKERKM